MNKKQQSPIMCLPKCMSQWCNKISHESLFRLVLLDHTYFNPSQMFDLYDRLHVLFAVELTMDLRQAQSSTRTCPAGRTVVSFSTPFSNPNKSSPMRLTLLSKWERCANMFTNSTPAFAFRTEPGAALWYWHPTSKITPPLSEEFYFFRLNKIPFPKPNGEYCTPWFR